MRQFNVHWGNRLELLAGAMFDALYGGKWESPMIPRCIVTNSPVMQAWLRHYFVYEWPGRHGLVLANCKFELLYPFVNSWMDRLLVSSASGTKSGHREPRHHPYAITCLQWRIYRLFEDGLADENGFAEIKAYLGDKPTPRRRFQLAGRLATLFDDYQVYRCDVLKRWEDGGGDGDWQAEMWLRLVKDNPGSYAALFRGMRAMVSDNIKKTIGDDCRQVSVFGTTAMPVAYVSFLKSAMAQAVDVDLYVLNPSQEYWFEDVGTRVVDRKKEALLLEDHPLKDEPLMLPEKGHPLLCSLGQGLQEHLLILEDFTEGVNRDPFKPALGEAMLADLQNRMLGREVGSCERRNADDSFQVHICHNPRREVEVLRDHLLKWLSEEKLQPYQVQVLLPDMETYAPLIDAVFSSLAPNTSALIPYVVDGRTVAADSVVTSAFRTLMEIVSSRFSAVSLLDLLRSEALAGAFDLSSAELEQIEQMVAESGVRWGLDAAHREQACGVAMEPYMTWEYSLDRLLLGYAEGAPELEAEPWPLDRAEAATAAALGKLARFIDRLKYYRERLQGERTAEEWHTILVGLLDTFFASTNTTCGEVAGIRRAINDLLPLAKNAGVADRKIPFDVMVAHLDGALTAGMRGDSLTANAVVFCQLRPMNSRPAEVVCVLGLNDGQFPRKDNRPTFDLLASTRHRGDRSVRRDDRNAFLEAMVNARKRLYLSYVGRSDSDNKIVPPSIVLQELRDHLVITYKLEEKKLEDGSRLLPFEVLHRLQSSHPAYFTGNELFSYSTTGFLTARQLVRDQQEPPPIKSGGLSNAAVDVSTVIELDTLTNFFLNPAQHYYRNVLCVNLKPKGPAVNRDEEMFVCNSLENYTLTTEILETFKKHDYDVTCLDRAGMLGRTKANGQVPLGAVGEAALAELVATADGWLGTVMENFPLCGKSVREILRVRDGAEPGLRDILITFPASAGVNVRGVSIILEGFDAPVQVKARPAEIKDKDRVRAWIAHLFACATCPAGVSTVIIGKENSETFKPLVCKEAQAALAELVGLFIEGQGAPLPFAPLSSMAYASVLQDQGIGTGCVNPDALCAATVAWGYRDNYGHGDECKDIWLFHAFGEEGPMADQHSERFVRAALTFFGRLQAARMAEAPAAAKNDREGNEGEQA